MRYLYLLFALFACSGQLAAAQTRPAALFPFTANGRWGFIDLTGAVVIAARFAQVQPFAEGLTPVQQGGRYDYIDATGRLVVPLAYDYATPFRQGLAVVWAGRVPRLYTN